MSTEPKTTSPTGARPAPPTPARPPLAARLRLPRWFTPLDRETRAGWRALRRAVATVPREELPDLLDDLHRKVVSHVEYDEEHADLVINTHLYIQFPKRAPLEMGPPSPLVARCLERVREAGGRWVADLDAICSEELARHRSGRGDQVEAGDRSGAHPSHPGSAAVSPVATRQAVASHG